MTGFAALAITFSTGVCADEIYKWTDEEGNVHYEDRPSGSPSEQRLQFSYNRTDSDEVQNRVQAQRDMTTARQDAREEAAEKDQTRGEEQAAADQKVANCQQYRGQLKTMLESRRLYREDATGERVYLDDAARAEAREKAEDLIKENCGS
jgi:hypothetical protein